MKLKRNTQTAIEFQNIVVKSRSRHALLLVYLTFVLVSANSILLGQSSGGSTERQNPEAGNKADDNLRSFARVNPSTLAMELNLPLFKYPGRNGNSFPFSFSYSSKVWQLQSGITWWYSTPGGARVYVNDSFPLYADRTAAGWTSSLLPPRLDTELIVYDQYGKTFNFDLNETNVTSYYQELEGLVLHGIHPTNLISGPEQCGSVCTGGYTNVCVDGICSDWECQGWSFIGCHGTYDDPDPQQPNIPNPRYMHYVKRVRMQMPDGSMHEFRKSDKVFGYCAGTNNPYNGQNCEQDGQDDLGDFLAVDGSGMRLNRTTTESTLYLQNGGRYIFPSLDLYSGRQWYATEYIDADGNRTTFSQLFGSNGEEINKWVDTLGREMIDPLPHNWSEQTQSVRKQIVDMPGLDGEFQHYELEWLKLKGNNDRESALADPNEPLSYETPRLCRGNIATSLPPTGSNNGILFGASTSGVRLCNPSVEDAGDIQPSLFNPTVLAKINLPNGKSYKFKYNVFGEITRIEYPTGSSEEFDYDKIIPVSGTNSSVFDQANRGVVEHRIYNSGHTLEQRWKYSASVNNGQYPIPADAPYKITTLGPKQDNATADQLKTERYLKRFDVPRPGALNGNFGFADPRTGMPFDERAYDDNGELRSRTLTEWAVSPPTAGGDSRATRDAKVTRSVSVIIEGGQALATLSENVYQNPDTDNGVPSDASYFARSNVKQSKSHHFRNIPFSLAQSGTLEQIAGYFNSSTVATIGETDYVYNENYKNRGISSLPKETRTLDPGDNSILTKSQVIYDNQLPAASLSYPGGYSILNYGFGASMDCSSDPQNPKVCWVNPNSAYLGNPTTSKVWKKDDNTWIETHKRYDQFGNVISARDPIGNEATTEFAADYKYAYLTSVTTPAPDPNNTGHGTNETSTATTTYDFTTGLSLTVTDQFGQTIKTQYNDELLRPTKVYGLNFTAPISETIYDDDALTVKVRKQLDATNWDEATTYLDGLGRTTKTVAKDSQGDVTVDKHYDFLGEVTEVTSPYRSGDPVLWSKTSYDELGRAIESFAPAASGTGQSLGTTSYEISTASGYTGTVVTTTDAALKKARSITNALGQLIRVDEPDHTGGLAPLPQSTPDPSPTPSPTPDGPPPSCVASCLTNADYPSYSTIYRYNALGKMVEVVQGDQKRDFMYDSLGRLLRVRQPEQEFNGSLEITDSTTGNKDWTAGFAYDILGNVVRATDANGVNIINEYDRAGRVIKRCYTKPAINTTATNCAGIASGDVSTDTPAVDFFYDGQGLDQLQTPHNFAKGKLTKVDNGVSQTRNTLFDNFGRLTASEQKTPVGDETMTNAPVRVSTYTYNLSGALIQETYPSGRVVKNEFESDGDLIRIYGKANANATEQTYANAFSYTPDGKIEKLKLGNGLWESAKFNTRLQVKELALGHSVGDGSLWKLGYEYGELQSDGTVDTARNTGNIAKQTVSFSGITNPFVQAYKYDSLYRLKEAKETVNGADSWIQTFGYDRFGNRNAFYQKIGVVELSLNNQTFPAIDPATNRFAADQGYSYDKNGNLTHDPASSGRTFVFNADNKQTEVKDVNGASIGRYSYDGEGKRVKKVTDLETTVFVYSSGKLIAEYSTATPPSNPTTSYTATDQLGSPRVLTDSLGQVVSRRDFMPFGEELYADGQNRTTNGKYSQTGQDSVRKRFTGYEKDIETALDFAEARYYDNQHARFTAVDPLLASGKSPNPQTFNRYVYVLNNPLVLTDPDGLQVGFASGYVYRSGNNIRVYTRPGVAPARYERVRTTINSFTKINGVLYHWTITPTSTTVGDRVDNVRFPDPPSKPPPPRVDPSLYAHALVEDLGARAPGTMKMIALLPLAAVIGGASAAPAAGAGVLFGATVVGEALLAHQSIGNLAESEHETMVMGSLNSDRSWAVNQAWRDEEDLVRETGRGTQNWTAEQKQELLETGRVKDYQGHHINSVNGHPEQARDPSNVEFVPRDEHFERHFRNWRNPTEGPLRSR